MSKDRHPVSEDCEVHEDSIDEEEEETEDTSPIQDLIESLEKSEVLIEPHASSRGQNGKNHTGDGSSQKEAFPSSPKSPNSPEVKIIILP